MTNPLLILQQELITALPTVEVNLWYGFAGDPCLELKLPNGELVYVTAFDENDSVSWRTVGFIHWKGAARDHFIAITRAKLAELNQPA